MNKYILFLLLCTCNLHASDELLADAALTLLSLRHVAPTSAQEPPAGRASTAPKVADSLPETRPYTLHHRESLTQESITRFLSALTPYLAHHCPETPQKWEEFAQMLAKEFQGSPSLLFSRCRAILKKKGTFPNALTHTLQCLKNAADRVNKHTQQQEKTQKTPADPLLIHFKIHKTAPLPAAFNAASPSASHAYTTPNTHTQFGEKVLPHLTLASIETDEAWNYLGIALATNLYDGSLSALKSRCSSALHNNTYVATLSPEDQGKLRQLRNTLTRLKNFQESDRPIVMGILQAFLTPPMYQVPFSWKTFVTSQEDAYKLTSLQIHNIIARAAKMPPPLMNLTQANKPLLTLLKEIFYNAHYNKFTQE